MPSLASPDHWPTAQPFEFGGVNLVDVDLVSAVRGIEDAAHAKRSQGLHLCNAYTLTLATQQSEYRHMLAHDQAVNLPDGTPVAWYFRLAHRRPARGPVRGPSLMKATLARTTLRHFLLGGTEEVLADLERVIARRYPGADVVGRLAPPFAEPGPEEIDGFAQVINECGAQVVWVGLGTPRQDRVIAALVDKVDAVLIGVGAAFDFLSGHKAEAPVMLHQTGLEWTYRLAQEPRRLWRRYLVGNTLFIISAARQLPSARRTDALSTKAGRARVDTTRSVPLPRVSVGGAQVHCVDERTALDLLVDAAKDGSRPWLVVTPNIQHIALLETDPELQACFERADLVLADGWPVVRAVRVLTGQRVQRITGADMFPAMCEEAARHGLSVGIVGGMDGAATQAAMTLRERFPGLDVVCALEPPWGFESDPAALAKVIATVKDARLDLLFLALGTPKQENFAARHLDEFGASVTLCVGAAVDFVAGRQRRAPRMLRRVGLEWAYRAMHEPRRLLPRYARSAPVFLRAVSRNRR